MKRVISEKRQKLIDEKKASKLTVGEVISVLSNRLGKYKDPRQEGKTISCIVISIKGNRIKVRHEDDSVRKDTYEIRFEDIKSRDLRNIGSNPFEEDSAYVRPVAFSLESILFNLRVIETDHVGDLRNYEIQGIKLKELNWNPFVYNKEGKKEYYQRGFVWNLQDKQLLLESIYHGIDCGKIIVRKRSWSQLEKMAASGEKELAFNDLVDGKQRLDAIRGFIAGEYTDAQGNYYGDLSAIAQIKLTDNQLFSFAEMGDDSSDEDVIRQFLKLNFTGVPQSREHIDFVKSIQKNI